MARMAEGINTDNAAKVCMRETTKGGTVVPTMPARRKIPATGKNRALVRLRPIVLRVARGYGARNVRVFGSFARGEQRRTSDLDLLVELPKGASLLDLAGLKVDLEEAVGRKVDVVEPHCIKPLLMERILAEARPL